MGRRVRGIISIYQIYRSSIDINQYTRIYLSLPFPRPRWMKSHRSMASIQIPLPLSFGRLPASPRHPRRLRQPVRCAAEERQALFNRIAPLYDNLNDLLSLGQHRVWKRMSVSWSGAKVGDRVLDLCCGSGDLAFLLSEKVGSDGKVFGLDFSKEQLLIASSRQHLHVKRHFSNIEWVEGDAINLPFPDSFFDAITMGYGLRNVVDRERALMEMVRVLKSGSKVSILDFNKSTQPMPSSFRDWMIDNVVVPVASSYGLGKEYEYLKSSINEYLTGPELEKLALQAGFSNAAHYKIGGGIMGNLVAVR
ncbi:hypothetical protein SAY87_028855 [Trapa incisa]|uniref:2-phytyl-1,4-beta-naphthoquinone methyltransferase, chloroplastic n=1 Tax=Trapa incisa TaxID=236973 RepID=A0AAN7QQH2_9MYRT|nr:hypothetical protein SAY87_028855 [Trapa incisa]